MKTIFIAMIILALCGCRIERDIQVEFLTAELIKVDTVNRYPKDRKQLTWLDQNNIRYVSYISIDKPIAVGVKILVMKPR